MAVSSILNNNPAKRSKRERMFLRDPHCFWCARLTVFRREKPIHKPDSATVDHLYSNFHPKRKTDRSSVLACFECNNARSTAECRFEEFIPKLECRLEIAKEASATQHIQKPRILVYRPKRPAPIRVYRPIGRGLDTLEKAIAFARE